MDVNQKLQNNLREYMDSQERIRDMKVDAGVGVPVDVSPEAKAQMYRDLYAKHKRRYDELAQEKIATVQANLERTRAEAFKPRVGTDSYTHVMMSYRDALDRLDGITSPSQLRDRLAQAAEIGDGVMAKAILFRGYTLGADFGADAVVGDYLRRYPGEQQRWSAFMDAAEAHNDLERMGVCFQPLPLQGVSGTPQEAPPIPSPLRAVE